MRLPPCEACTPFSICRFRRFPQPYFSGFMSFITLLLLSSVSAYGEWVSTASSDSLGGYTTYFDPDTFRPKGNVVKVWSLNDFKTVQIVRGELYWSSKLLDKYDCTEEQIRNLAYFSYGGQMGTREVQYSDTDPGKWVPVMPNSVGETMWKAACGTQ